MELRPWNPWEEMERAQGEVEALLNTVLRKIGQSLGGKPISFMPATDITEAAGEYLLSLSLPGMVEEDIDISLEGSILIVRGVREPPYDPAAVTVHQQQWRYGYFERRVQLPETIDFDSIQAGYDSGVLTIRIPKSPPGAGGEAKETPRAGEAPEGEKRPSAEEKPEGGRAAEGEGKTP